MKNLHVAKSPITNRIFCGSVLKDGMTWASNKTDVTGEACAAVAQHVLERGEPVVVTANGKPEYEITVRSLRPNALIKPTPLVAFGLNELLGRTNRRIYG